MREVLYIVAAIITIGSALIWLIPRFRRAFNKVIRSKQLLWYLLISMFVISLVDILIYYQANKKIDVLYKHCVNPYMDTLVSEIRVARDSCGFETCPKPGTPRIRKYPEQISDKCQKLRDLQNADITLTSESYFELGLWSYYLEKYDGAIRCAEKAWSRDPYSDEACYLLSISYKCEGKFDLARFYYNKYDELRRLRESDIPGVGRVGIQTFDDSLKIK